MILTMRILLLINTVTLILSQSFAQGEGTFTRESNESAAKLANLKLLTDRNQRQNELDKGTVTLTGFKKLSGPRATKKTTKTSKTKKCSTRKKVKGKDGCGKKEVGKLSIDTYIPPPKASNTDMMTPT